MSALAAVAVLSGCVVQEVPLSAPVEEGTVEPDERDVIDVYTTTKDRIDQVMGVADASGDGLGDWRYRYSSFSGCTPPDGGPGARFMWRASAEPQHGTGVPEQTAGLVAEYLETLGLGEVSTGRLGESWLATTGDQDSGAFVRYSEWRSAFVEVVSACIPGDSLSADAALARLKDDGTIDAPPLERFIDDIQNPPRPSWEEPEDEQESGGSGVGDEPGT